MRERPIAKGSDKFEREREPRTGRTTTVLPTYNEAYNLQDMVEALLGLGIQGVEILVVNQRVWQMRLFPRDSEEE